MTLNDLENQKEVFLEFVLQFTAAAHFSTVNCDEIAGDRPRQPARVISSIKRRF